MKNPRPNLKYIHVMILQHIVRNLGSFVLAQDVNTAGDSRIFWSTFPVKTCFYGQRWELWISDYVIEH